MEQRLQDLQEYVDHFRSMTCIISVRKLPDGGYGDIRIVTGNAAYLASVEHPVNASSPARKDQQFIPNMPYEHYILKDLNFEDSCRRCAIEGQPLHAYIYPERYNFWFDIFMLPLDVHDGDVYYCTYSMVLMESADTNKMTDISYETLANVMSACIKLRSSDSFESAIQSVIEDIRDVCEAEHCCILLTDAAHRSCTVLAEAFAKDTAHIPMVSYVDDDFYDIANSWMDTIAGSSCLIVKDSHDMEELSRRNPAWYRSLMIAHVNSVVLFPLRTHGGVVGYIWAVDFDTRNTIKIKDTLELTSLFIASEIASYQMIGRLKTLSEIDLLTGISNRNAMNNRVDQFTWSQTLGVVFADLNGLKTVNDNEGHYAGDLLLKNAALVLQRIFVGNEIYRAGGDEFVIIAQDITQEELDRRMMCLRESSECEDSPSFAIGAVFADEKCDIRNVMQLADERMYEDKSIYYEHHPEKARR